MPEAYRDRVFIFSPLKRKFMSWFNKSSQSSDFLKLQKSKSEDNLYLNKRGDRVKVYSPTNIFVNGTKHRSEKSAWNAINQWGQKK